MTNREIASAVLGCVGGVGNVVANSLCMTRLRITVATPSLVRRDSLDQIDGVLGTTSRGANGIEVVFGPALARSVYQEFSTLTGLDSFFEPLIGSRRPETNFAVHISPGKRKSYAAQAAALDEGPTTAEEDDDDMLGHLAELLDDTDERPVKSDVPKPKLRGNLRLLVLNGPGVNMLGSARQAHDWTVTYSELLKLCHETAKRAGFASCRCIQSNHEGDLIDAIQDAPQTADGIVINAGAYAHTSVAISDSLKIAGVPTIEVHIAFPIGQEEFRDTSYVASACIGTIHSRGPEGYREAILRLADYLAG